MKFDTGPAPKGLGVIEVEIVIQRTGYTVGKCNYGKLDEISYVLFDNGNVGIAQKNVLDTSEETHHRIDKELVQICEHYLKKKRKESFLAKLEAIDPESALRAKEALFWEEL